WRGRASATWRLHGLSLTGVASYTGELEDPRFAPVIQLPDQLQFDFAARYQTGDAGPHWLRGIDLTFTITNIFNAEPPPIQISSVRDTPYDSTNYSPLGRVISL